MTAVQRLFGNKEMRILMLGLDAAGKTSESFFEEALECVGLLSYEADKTVGCLLCYYSRYSYSI